MRYRVLGPPEVARDGAALQIPRRRERCLLGVLLLDVGRFIAVERLIDLLWEEDPPEQVRGTLRSHVARIRC